MSDRAIIARRHGGQFITLAAFAFSLLYGLALMTAPRAAARQVDYLAQLNRPIDRISDDNKVYPVYFEAISMIDLDGAPLTIDALRIGAAGLDAAIEWVGQESQKEAIDILLKDDGSRPNAAYREVLGLPYGIADLPEEMILEDFAIYIIDNQLHTADFAYLRQLDLLRFMLIAEGHRAWSAGEGERGSEAFGVAARIGRQLMDRDFVAEKTHGIDAVIETVRIIREAMWQYRDQLTVNDYSDIGDELDYLHVENLDLPRANLLVGRQIVETIYGPDNMPDTDSFASVLSKFESRDQPLKRFEASAKWREMIDRHGNQSAVLDAVENVDGDFRRRWRYRWDDLALLSEQSLYKKLDPVEFAVVKLTYEGVEPLFVERYRVVAEVFGTIASAGVAGYHTRDGVPPQRIEQVQPAIVGPRMALMEIYSTSGSQLGYAVIQNRDAARRAAGYEIETPHGTVHLDNGSPLLYSIGWDLSSQYGAKAVLDPVEGATGDLVFWPPVIMLARTNQEATF